MLKGVNRCLEKVKTSEQPRWLCCPCKQCSLFIDLARKIIEDTLEDKMLSSSDFRIGLKIDGAMTVVLSPDLRFAELAGEPVEALVKSMALHGAGGLDVPLQEKKC